MKVLLSAFACDPSKGSEPYNGWNWAIGLAGKGYETHCLTREEGKEAINSHAIPGNLHFHYVVLPWGMERLYYASTAGMYLYYLLWQWKAYRMAKLLNKASAFSVAHHVTWGSLQMGSFMYKLKLPFIFGPVGGGQTAPKNFKHYFLNHWSAEEKREKISHYLLTYSPACKQMLANASAVLVSNEDTRKMAAAAGAKNIHFKLDVALPDSFFPAAFAPKKTIPGRLRLLWVGRFMPRKGLLLVLDVMKELKTYRSITLTIVGDGEMRDVILNKIAAYGLEETVSWKGAVPFDTIRNFYASHDVFFFTSLRDSGGMQLVEAMAFGLPVITINLHGQAMIVNEQTGIKCACDTPELAIRELRKAILLLYQNGDRVTEMSAAAYAYALEQNWTNKLNYVTKQYYPAS